MSNESEWYFNGDDGCDECQAITGFYPEKPSRPHDHCDCVIKPPKGCDKYGPINPSFTRLRDLQTNMRGETKVFLNDIYINGCVRNVGGIWKIGLITAGMYIHWGTNKTKFKEPILPPSSEATINCSNVFDAINSMLQFVNDPMAGSREWHMDAATVAHEEDHMKNIESSCTIHFIQIQQSIAEHVLGTVGTVTYNQAIELMMAHLESSKNDWFEGVRSSPPPESTAYAAEVPIIKAKIKELEDWMQENCF